MGGPTVGRVAFGPPVGAPRPDEFLSRFVGDDERRDAEHVVRCARSPRRARLDAALRKALGIGDARCVMVEGRQRRVADVVEELVRAADGE